MGLGWFRKGAKVLEGKDCRGKDLWAPLLRMVLGQTLAQSPRVTAEAGSPGQQG